MPVLKVFEKKNVWESICKEFQAKKVIDDKKNEIVEFDPAKHNPVFYGYGYAFNKVDDAKLLNDFDSSITHPCTFGYSIQIYNPKDDSKTEIKSRPEKEKCTEREYIEHYVFPTLLPALESMLAEAKLHKCFERKRTAFNACDFLTDYLYKNNPFRNSDELSKRRSKTIWEIPFVKEWIQIYPRPPLPKSLIWTEEEAAVKIQAFFRGYLVRCDAEVQELRKWQRDLREENQNIIQRVEKFWNDSSNAKKSNHSENSSSAIFSSNSLTK